MKRILLSISVLAGGLLFSQSIDFKGCTPLFDDQQFTLNQTGTDLLNKRIYVTTPVDGDQPCGGLGTCEFKIQWNENTNRWEFLADSGDGDFVNPFLIYYSTTGNTSADNPPNITIGNWAENTAVTQGQCGGNLTEANATMTGDVRTSDLGTAEEKMQNVSIAPNPATDFLIIYGVKDLRDIRIISADGRLISVQKNIKVNVTTLPAGAYFLEINTNIGQKTIKFIKK